MREAGYTFDFEKKELKKTVAHKFEVGDTMRTIQEAANGVTDGLPVVISIDNEYYHCNNESIAIKDQDDYEYPPMSRRQKSAWSEKDEKYLKLAIDNFQTLGNSFLTAWLNSLKDRVLPQSKKEWSEKDLEMLSGIELDLSMLMAKNPDCEFKKLYQEEIDWLKSLKPQKHQ